MSEKKPLAGSLSSTDPEPTEVSLTVREGQRVSPAVRLTSGESSTFRDELERVYRAEHDRLFAYIQRLCGDADLAADVVQDTFVRFQRRGSSPDSAGAWLVTVATNLLRNARSRSARRQELLAAAAVVQDAAVEAADLVAAEERMKVRGALARLAPRDQELLSLLAGGYRYREMAVALGLNEASVGTLLSRAKRAFKDAYGAIDDSH